MIGSERVTEYGEIDRALFQCIRQPGRLRITRHTCAIRYLKAQKKRSAVKDEFDMAREASLKICRNCPEGLMYAKHLKNNRSKKTHKCNTLHKPRKRENKPSITAH